MNIGVDEQIYTFAENASTVEVCLVTSNDTVYCSNICFNINVLPESSSAKGMMVMQSVENVFFLYYIEGEDFTSSVSSVTLRAGETAVCSHLNLNPDSLVEGNESLYLAFTNNDIILNGGLGLHILIGIDDSTGSYVANVFFLISFAYLKFLYSFRNRF